LQKSQAALQEFVTAMLQRAGPPPRMSRSMLIYMVLIPTGVL
jgi:hypothetical protein